MGYGLGQLGVNQRLIALHIHNDAVIRQLQQGAGLRQTVAAAGVVAVGKNGLHAKISTGLHNARVVGGYYDARRHIGCGLLHLLHALRYTHNHGNAANVSQRLFGQAGAVQACGNQDGVWAHGGALFDACCF